MQRYFDVVQTQTGRAISGASVSVYDSNGDLATLYSDNGVTVEDNPLTTNDDGEYAFYAANGTYSMAIVATGYTGQDLEGVILFDPEDSNFGYLNIPVNSQSAAYVSVLADQGCLLLHPSTDATPRTFTIAANASVPYQNGTAITFVNDSSGAVTIAINSDTLVMVGPGTTGSRTLAQYGMATAVKISSTRWYINGTNLS